MEKRGRLALDVGLTFVASMTSVILGLIVSVLLGRYLGASELGLYKMATVVYSIAFLAMSFGIPATITKFVAESRGDRRRMGVIVSSGIITTCLVGAVSIPVFFSLAGIFESLFGIDGLAAVLRIITATFPFALIGGLYLGVLNGLREMRKFAVATILQASLMLLLSVVMILLGFGVRGVVVSMAISSAGACLYLSFVCRRLFTFTSEKYVSTARRIVKFGSQVVGANAVNLVNYQGDLLLIGYFLTSTDVGHYGVAIGLAKFMWLFPQAVQTITYPAISEHWSKNDTNAISGLIRESTKFTAIILVPIGLAVGFYAKEIIDFVMGSGFDESVLPLQILLIGTVANGVMQRPIGSILFSLGVPGLNLRIFSAAAIVNVSLNVILIPLFGVTGAAVASSLTYVMISILVLFVVRRITGATVDSHWFVKVWSLALISLLAYGFLLHSGLPEISVIVVVAVATVIWFGFTNPEERSRFCKSSRNTISSLLGLD